MKRPNVLLIYTDQQRWDTIGLLNPSIQTPNLDRLAERGAIFDHCFVNSPVCMPSRQSMLSGLYPSTVGTVCNGIHMPEDVLTVQKALGLYGYHTANIGKLHFWNHSDRDHRDVHPSYGFDLLTLSDEPGCYDDAYIKWVEEHDPAQVDNCRIQAPIPDPVPEYQNWRGEIVPKPPRGTHTPYVFEGPENLTHSAFVADEVSQYLDTHANRPFFVIAGMYAPHAPLNPPARFVEMYDPSTLETPCMNEGEDRYDLTADEWRVVKAYYYALITHIDDQVGRILESLKRNGLEENTLVVFTSDHGEHLGDHGLTGKGAAYDSCARVPLIVSYPGHVKAGELYHEIIEHVDLVPTILDYCGIQVPRRMQGRTFRALLESKVYEPRTSAYMEIKIPFGHAYKALRTYEYLYVVERSRGQVSEKLFNMQTDIHQLTDIARESGADEALADMRRQLLARWFEVESQYPLRTASY